MMISLKNLRVLQVILLGVISHFTYTSETFASETNVAAARVIMVRGEAVASDQYSNVRSLSRRSVVYVGDSLKTMPNSLLQLRFSDNAVMTLRENTEFHISEYVPGDSSKGGSALMELVSGGFRTVTGSIGKGSRDDYKVTTTAGSIGIRGTFYEAVTNESGTLLLAAWKGAIEVDNAEGSMVLGDNQAFRYARVPRNAPPIGLTEPAPELAEPDQGSGRSDDEDSDDDSSSSDKDSESNEDSEGDDGDSNEQESESDDGSSSSADSGQSDSNDTSSQTADSGGSSGGDTSGGLTGDGGELLSIALTDSPTTSIESETQQVIENVQDEIIEAVVSDATPTDTGDTDTTTDNTDTGEPPVTDTETPPTGFTDTRLTQSELDQLTERQTLGLGLLVSPANSGSHPKHLKVIEDANGNPVFFATSGPASDRLFRQEDLGDGGLDFYRVGNAAVSVTDNVDGNNLVSWGIWNGTAEGTQLEHHTPTSGDSPVLLQQQIFWLTAEPDIDLDLSGTITYSADTNLGSPFLAGSSMGAVDSVTATFNVNFDRATMDPGSALKVSFDDTATDKYWNVILDDTVLNFNNSQFTLDIDNNTSSEAYLGTAGTCSDCINGSISGILFNQGNGIGSAFNLEATGTNGTEHTDGLILLNRN